jgi:hypothetical protein
MPFKLNGTELTHQPTEARWLPRDAIAFDGNGHAIYPSIREFEMRFALLSPAEYNQMMSVFNSVGATGTAVVTLPQFGAATYTFYDYSGCVLQEPVAQEYFAQHQTSITLLISRIRT